MKKKLAIVAVTLVTVLAAQAAFAHRVWLATRLGKTQLALGEGPDDPNVTRGTFAACLSFLVRQETRAKNGLEL